MPKKRTPAAPAAPDLSHIAGDLQAIAEPLESLIPDPANVRLHDERQLDRLVRLLDRFGQRTPIVCNARNRIILAGNGVYQAACRLNWSQIAVAWVDHDPATAIGYSIADNRTAELATWDESVLAEQLTALRDLDLALVDCTGFDDSELEDLLAACAPTAPDRSDLLIRVDDEPALESLLTELAGRGLEARRFVA